MDYTPQPHQDAGTVDAREVRERLRERADRFDRCFARHQPPARPHPARLDLRGYVSPAGRVVGVEFSKNHLPGPTIDCVRRELRAVQFPLVVGHYGTFEHALEYRPPSEGSP